MKLSPYVVMLVWNIFLFGGCAYLVFWRGGSPLMFILACFLMLTPSSKNEE